ncbi:copper resistance CopC/CopD family protein [Aneurinibacillus aneurinilyticus]|uniref:copper resistance CopC/CopD family protein n=1 Tax=Aneurinibacillus aneurinilyticus TaxID=1391 RepID=UPI0023F3273B|nr:CopD family protein [Aneurinibacillus aneurinilyticus]
MVVARKGMQYAGLICLLLLSIAGVFIGPASVAANPEPEKTVPAKKEYSLAESSPKDGSLLDASPKEVRLIFNEPFNIEYTTIFDNRNREYSTGRFTVNPNDPRQVILKPARELAPGTYGVEWYGKAPVPNGKAKEIKGQLYFAVQSLSPPPKSGGAGLLEQLSGETLPGWIAFFGMLVSFGGTLFVRFIARNNDVHKRWQYWQIPIYFLTATAVMILFFVRKSALPEISINELAGLHIGWVPLVQFLVFTLIFGITYTRWTLPFLGAMLALNTLVGHSNSSEYGGWLAMMMNTLHLFALAIWFGGLFALLVLAPKEGKGAWFKEKGAVFSRWALISMPVIVLTGIGMTIEYIPSWNDFIGSAWGISVLAKSGLVIAIILLGYMQMHYIKKGGEKGTVWFARRTKWELWLGTATLLVAAALVNFIPLASGITNSPAQLTKEGVTAHMAVSPFVSGFNDVNIRFENAPPLRDVYVRFVGSSEYTPVNRAFDLGEGRYRISGDQLRSPSTTYIRVEAIAQDGHTIVFTFPPRGEAVSNTQ